MIDPFQHNEARRHAREQLLSSLLAFPSDLIVVAGQARTSQDAPRVPQLSGSLTHCESDQAQMPLELKIVILQVRKPLPTCGKISDTLLTTAAFFERTASRKSLYAIGSSPNDLTASFSASRETKKKEHKTGHASPSRQNLSLGTRLHRGHLAMIPTHGQEASQQA